MAGLSSIRRAGATRYRIDRAAYELPPLDLAEDEKRALEVAAATVRLDRAAAGAALLKVAPDEERGDLLGSTLASLPPQPGLVPLFAACATRAVAGFRYHGKVRAFEPWGLFARDGFWYAEGHDRDARRARAKLDRDPRRARADVERALGLRQDREHVLAERAVHRGVVHGVVVMGLLGGVHDLGFEDTR